MSLIELKNISKSFNKNKVLDDLTIEFSLDEFVVIIGQSGCGKSTLLNLLDFSLKADSGKYFITEENPYKNQEMLKQTVIKRIHQKSNLIEYYTVYENLKLVCIISDIDESIIDDYLERFNLKSLRDKYPNQISVGEGQRISLIRALLCNPLILLADEPTGSLDEKNAKRVMDTLYKNRKGKLIVVVTHNEKIKDIYGETIIRIEEGKAVVEKQKELSTKKVKISFEKPKSTKPKDVFLLNIKSLKKRKTITVLLMFIVIIMASFLSCVSSIRKGINNYIKQELSSKIDDNIFQIFYINETGKKEEKQLSNFIYDESNVSLYNIFNNYLYQELKVGGKSLDFYFEYAFIKEDNLANQAYINSLFLKQGNFKKFHFNNEFINEEILVKSIIEETELYNVPRIILSYDYWFDLIKDSGLLDKLLSMDESLKYVRDYFVEDSEKALQFLKEQENTVSFYKQQILNEKNVFVYNNSTIMIRETFSDLMDNIFLIIKILSIFIITILCFLFYFIFRYSFFQRKLELAVALDNGAGQNYLSTLLLSDIFIVLPGSFVFVVFIQFLLSKLTFENSAFLLKSNSKINVLPFNLFEIIKIFNIFVLLSLFLVIVVLKEVKKQEISEVLKEE